MDPSFRDATDDDVPAILEIYNEQILNGTATFHTEPQTVVERAEWLSKLKAKRYPCLVAELPEAGTGAKRTVAWANLQAYHDRPAYDGTAELSLYVHKDFRGTGIGQKLLRVFARRDEETGRPVPYDYIERGLRERTNNEVLDRTRVSASRHSEGSRPEVREVVGRVVLPVDVVTDILKTINSA